MQRLAHSIIHLFKGVRTWKLGASCKKTLEKTCQTNEHRLDDCKCSSSYSPSKCYKKQEKPCGSSKSWQEAISQNVSCPCYPDYTERRGPLLPTRGYLPWEKEVDICPTKTEPKVLETEACEHLCAPHVDQAVSNRLNIAECEWKKFKKCDRENLEFKSKCLDLKQKLKIPYKQYPMYHAEEKKFLPGCPTNLSQSVLNQKEEC